MLSSLSSIPPWPGIIFEKSFMPYNLFIAEKNKSPNCPIKLKNKTIDPIKKYEIVGSITVK